MKIYRGPSSTDNWSRTDEHSLDALAKEWTPAKVLRVDGTIDKLGSRHTDFGIQLDENDIIAMQRALQSYYASCIEDRDRQAVTARQLRAAMGRISSLLSSHRNEAPSIEALLEVVGAIADHYRWYHGGKEFQSKVDWLDWESL